MAVVFALVGLVIFIILYMKNMDGKVADALRDPSTILVVLVPFLPAVVLSFMATRAESALKRMIEDARSGQQDKGG